VVASRLLSLRRSISLDDLAEGSAGAPHFRLELGRHLIDEGERRLPVLMLRARPC
jgi:hypothetical protein